MEDIKLCMGCMNELDENGKCRFCKYDENVPHQPQFLAPHTLLDERYILGRVLSFNGESVSYMGYDSIAKCKVVVREYMPDTLCERDLQTGMVKPKEDCLAKYKTFMADFEELNRALSKMRSYHHVITCTNIINTNNTAYAVLEYAEGVSLKKFLQTNKGYLTWEQVKSMFKPLFNTLSLIHKSGLIHRGLSPENIIVTTNGELKLTGFCISAIRTVNSGLSQELYSGYAAPEQYSSLEWQGTWTDVYSIAAVMYRILTGCVPVDAYNRIEDETLIEPAKINTNIPSHISNVIMQAMRVRGETRLQTVDEFVTKLFDQPAHNNSHGSTQMHKAPQSAGRKPVPKQNNSQKTNGSAGSVKPKSQNKTNNRNNNRLEKNPPRKTAEQTKLEPSKVLAGIGVITVTVALGLFALFQIVSPATNSTPITNTQSSVAEQSSSDIDQNSIDLGTGKKMPNVLSLTYDDAMKQLGTDFEVERKSGYSDDYQKGTIMEQSIPEGADYSPENYNHLVLTECMGAENVRIPEYTGFNQRDYLSKLDELNVKYVIEEKFDEDAMSGYVIGTSVEVGQSINVLSEDVLTVYVCKKQD